MDRFQGQAKEHYKRKDYHKALEFFDRAVGRGQSVQLLDSRAACHEKLGDLQTALKDAKRTIQLQREDPTGYLRAGKVLVKMERQSVALEIYTHGLKSIKHVGQGYERLRAVHKSLLEEVSPPQSVDPLSVLPRELVEYIFEYLSFKQRINACRVSKQWITFIRSTPHLWQHLDLTHARCKVRDPFISRAINTAKKRLTCVTLTNIVDSGKVFAALVAHCSLTEVNLLETGHWRGSMATLLSRATSLKVLRIYKGTILTTSCLADIVSACAASLETLEVESSALRSWDQSVACNMLTSIALMGLSSVEYFKLEILKRCCPSLRSLKIESPIPASSNGLWNLDIMPKFDNPLQIGLEHLEVANYQVSWGDLELPPSLRVLRLRAAEYIMGRVTICDLGSPSATDILPYRLPLLEELILDFPGESLGLVPSLLVTHRSYSAKLTEQRDDVPSSLRYLSLQRFDVDGLHLVFDNSRLSEVRQLDLCLAELTDEHIAVVLKKCPKLERLDLSNSMITGVAVGQIVRETKIKHLTLYECRKLSIDAVHWAREQGVRVYYRMTDPLNGGRRIRH